MSCVWKSPNGDGKNIRCLLLTGQVSDKLFDNVRNFVKNLYFILIQICFSQLKYITQHVFFKLKKRFCLRSVDAAWSKVFFLRRVRCGSVPLYTTKPAQAQGSRLPAMRHRSLNNFHKKWDNNKKFSARTGFFTSLRLYTPDCRESSKAD